MLFPVRALSVEHFTLRSHYTLFTVLLLLHAVSFTCAFHSISITRLIYYTSFRFKRSRRTAHHRRQTIWSHHACPASVAVASCPATSRLQNRMPGAPVAVWFGTGIFSWWHQPCRRSAVDRTMCRSTYTQHLWFHCGRSTSVEQSTVSVWQGINYEQFRQQLKTSLFVINWPWCIVIVCLLAP